MCEVRRATKVRRAKCDGLTARCRTSHVAHGTWHRTSHLAHGTSHVTVLPLASDELGARTVAFPAISTGVYGYPLHLAAPIAVGTVAHAKTDVEEVRFVLFDEEAFDAFQKALDALVGPGPESGRQGRR